VIGTRRAERFRPRALLARRRAGHLESRLRLPVSTALAVDAPTVAPDMTVTEFVRRIVIGRHVAVAPLAEDGQLLGLIGLGDVDVLPIVNAQGRYAGLLSTGTILALSELLDESDDYGPRTRTPGCLTSSRNA
jgi:CBS domain-containing protein